TGKHCSTLLKLICGVLNLLSSFQYIWCSRRFLKGPYHPFCMFESIYSIFIQVTLLTIISQRIKPYISFPDILQNLLIFQNQIFKRYIHLKNRCFTC
ncbi:hypothetical protein LDENG_00121620, partial [Lucifuga dentata]